MKKKGQAGIAGAIIGILIASIIGIAVVIPVATELITAGSTNASGGTTCSNGTGGCSLTGTTLTVVNLIPLMVGVVVFVAVAAVITIR